MLTLTGRPPLVKLYIAKARHHVSDIIIDSLTVRLEVRCPPNSSLARPNQNLRCHTTALTQESGKWEATSHMPLIIMLLRTPMMPLFVQRPPFPLFRPSYLVSKNHPTFFIRPLIFGFESGRLDRPLLRSVNNPVYSTKHQYSSIPSSTALESQLASPTSFN